MIPTLTWHETVRLVAACILGTVLVWVVLVLWPIAGRLQP